MAKVQSSFWRQNDHPAWAGDFLDRNHLVPAGARLNTAVGFPRSDQVVLNLDATSQPQTTVALENPAAKTGKVTGDIIIPSGARLRVGAGHYLQLTAEVAVGDTDITVESTLLDTTTAQDATYDGVALLVIPSGILIGRTYAQNQAGTPFELADDSDDIMYLIAFPIQVDLPMNFGGDVEQDVALYRHGSVVKTNFLPDFGGLSAAQTTFLREHYATQLGAA